MSRSPGPQYELGVLVGGIWKQWANAAGQDYYQNMSTGAEQYRVPAGWEDVATDTWAVDGSKSWPQWRNMRTGRINRNNPNPPTPRNYLETPLVQIHLQNVERVPESHEYMYRRVMTAVLKHHFTADKGFDVLQEESRGATSQGQTKTDIAVLKITSRPGGSMYVYDYCLVESKRAGGSWPATESHLGEHCAGTENASSQVYGIVHIGLYVQFFTANRGVLTAQSGRLHLRNDVNQVAAMLEYMRKTPLPFL